MGFIGIRACINRRRSSCLQIKSCICRKNTRMMCGLSHACLIPQLRVDDDELDSLVCVPSLCTCDLGRSCQKLGRRLQHTLHLTWLSWYLSLHFSWVFARHCLTILLALRYCLCFSMVLDVFSLRSRLEERLEIL